MVERKLIDFALLSSIVKLRFHDIIAADYIRKAEVYTNLILRSHFDKLEDEQRNLVRGGVLIPQFISICQ